jgi:hypothetical protein
MSRLEDLQPNSSIRGVIPGALVTVASLHWLGSEALEITYKDPAGRVANQLLYRYDEPRLEVVEESRPPSLDCESGNAVSDGERHVVLWRRLDRPGHDHCKIHPCPRGHSLDGYALSIDHRVPWRFHYQAECYDTWCFYKASVSVEVAGQDESVSINLSEDGKWVISGMERPDLEGCTDLDFCFSPSIKTFALRRLDLPPGEEAVVKVAWLELGVEPFETQFDAGVESPEMFFALSIIPIELRYRRLNWQTWSLEAPALGFSGELFVSDQGIVLNHPPMWRIERGRAGRRKGNLHRIAKKFAEYFGKWDVVIPPEDLINRRRGFLPGYPHSVKYLFGEDEKDEFMDYRSESKWGDDHVRIYASGKQVALPYFSFMHRYSSDPAEAARLEKEYFEENRRIDRMLEIKGFGTSGDEPPGALINQFLALGGSRRRTAENGEEAGTLGCPDEDIPF